MQKTIAELRGFRLNQKQLAKLAGISRSTLCRIESGRLRPTSQEVDAIAGALRVERETILKIIEDQGLLWEPVKERQLAAALEAERTAQTQSQNRPDFSMLLKIAK